MRDPYDLFPGALAFLREVLWEEEALFPFSTSLQEGRLVSDYGHRHTPRYTVNTLLGLREAQRAGVPEPWLERVPGIVDRFLERHLDVLSDPADLGLVLQLLLDEPDSLRTQVTLARMHRAPDLREPRGLTGQQLAWMLWGASSAGRAGAPGAAELAASLFDLLRERFLDPVSGLPYHSLRLDRRRIVSFGCVVYALRALHEYACLTGDPDADALFADGVARMLRVQGPRGEWPWLIDVRRSVPLDYYPVFTVHQDSMAMLFLLPALAEGLPGVEPAIERSVAWVFGENELGIPMVGGEPFLAYRSQRRAEPLPKPRRYGRALANAIAGRAGALAGPGRVKVNPECRSYHLGWMLYVWAPEAARRSLVLAAAM